MKITSQLGQLLMFSLLALLSYAIYNKYFSSDEVFKYQPFTKGYALEGVTIKSTDEKGRVISTIESPSMIHYADTEISEILEPRYTMHHESGNWLFTSAKGEINPEQTQMYFPGEVDIELQNVTEKVSLNTSDMVVDINEKSGLGRGHITIIKPGMSLTGVGSVIDFGEQTIEINEDMYAEFEN